jgi:hypothetical protein
MNKDLIKDKIKHTRRRYIAEKNMLIIYYSVEYKQDYRKLGNTSRETHHNRVYNPVDNFDDIEDVIVYKSRLQNNPALIATYDERRCVNCDDVVYIGYNEKCGIGWDYTCFCCLSQIASNAVRILNRMLYESSKSYGYEAYLLKSIEENNKNDEPYCGYCGFLYISNINKYFLLKKVILEIKPRMFIGYIRLATNYHGICNLCNGKFIKPKFGLCIMCYNYLRKYHMNDYKVYLLMGEIDETRMICKIWIKVL